MLFDHLFLTTNLPQEDLKGTFEGQKADKAAEHPHHAVTGWEGAAE